MVRVANDKRRLSVSVVMASGLPNNCRFQCSLGDFLIRLFVSFQESGDLEGLDGVEALITNVGGWLLMLQKEKASHGRSKKVGLC